MDKGKERKEERRWKVLKERAGYSIKRREGMREVERLRSLAKQSKGETGGGA